MVPNVAKGYRLFRHREGSPGKRFKGGDADSPLTFRSREARAHVTPNPLLLSELAREARVSRTNFSPLRNSFGFTERLVNHPEAVEVMEMRTDTVIIVELRVAKEDRVIGKGAIPLSPSAQSCTRSEVGPTIGSFSRSSRLDESSYRRERKITGETRALVSFAGFLAERFLTGGASMEGADRDFKRAGEALSGELTKARADEVLARDEGLAYPTDEPQLISCGLPFAILI